MSRYCTFLLLATQAGCPTEPRSRLLARAAEYLWTRFSTNLEQTNEPILKLLPTKQELIAPG